MKWENQLNRLKEKIHLIQGGVKNDIAYGVVHILEPNGTTLDVHQNSPPIQASGGPLYSHFEVELYNSDKAKESGGETAFVSRTKLGQQHHFIFGWQWTDSDDVSPLNEFLRSIQEVPDILSKIPPSQLSGVEFKSPHGLNRDQENLILWMQFLMWISQKSREASGCQYQVVCEYADSVEGLKNGIGQWEHHPTVPGFDPVELVAWKAQSKSFLEDWQQQFQNSEKKLPAVMSASLSKPLFYASTLAISFFLNELVHRRQRKSNTHRKIDLPWLYKSSEKEEKIFNILLKHHGSRVIPNHVALSQKEIIKQSQFSQVEVSRIMKRLVQDMVEHECCETPEERTPMRAYKELCNKCVIVESLEKLSELCFQSQITGDS